MITVILLCIEILKEMSFQCPKLTKPVVENRSLKKIPLMAFLDH